MLGQRNHHPAFTVTLLGDEKLEISNKVVLRYWHHISLARLQLVASPQYVISSCDDQHEKSGVPGCSFGANRNEALSSPVVVMITSRVR